MKASRVTAVGLVAAAALWVLSGYLIPHETPESKAAVPAAESAAEKLFRVAVMKSDLVPHSRTLTLSGRTEADKKVTLTARTGGVLMELRVKRGERVEKGDIIAVLSDDAREARVAEARALFHQRKTELEARRKLIEQGSLPRLELVNLEAQYKAAEAALAAAEAERDRGMVRAPWDGVITEVPAEVGGAAFSMAGKEVAKMMAFDPMLAVVEVSETKLGGIRAGDDATVRLVTGQTARGKVRYVSKSATETTRTYRVEVELDNPDGEIPDGITAEVSLTLEPEPSTRVPRSALTFSSGGDLGVRAVNGEGKVTFIPVSIHEDEQAYMWLDGVPDGSRVIVQGQDFVREGQTVAAVPSDAVTSEAATARR